MKFFNEHQFGRVLGCALFLLMCSRAVSQVAQRDCGVTMSGSEAAALRAQERAGAYRLHAVPRHVLQVPIACHAIRRSDGSGGIDEATIDSGIAAANAAFAGAGIRFYRLGAVRSLNNSVLFIGVPDEDGAVTSLLQNGPVAGAVNCYFVPNLVNRCGQATLTANEVQGVLMSNDCMPPANTTTFPHELGHFFDLHHTHETGFGVECPDGSNCSEAGDLVCDTPADPDVSNRRGSGCQYAPGVNPPTACGQTYDPDVTNLMSYGGSCRTHFTSGQQARMLATLVNLRPALAGNTLTGVTWVDSDHSGSQTGAYATPYRTVGQGVTATAAGGSVVLKAGNYRGSVVLSRAVTLDAFGGPASIGVP